MPIPFIPPWNLQQQDILPPVYPGFDVPMNPQPDMSMPAVYGGVMPPPDFNQIRMQQLFNPEHDAQDRVNQLLGQMPTHEKPSFMRKLSASLVAGGGDYKQSQDILNQPYETQYNDWKDKFAPAYQAANLERYSNATERQAAQNQLNFESQNRRIDEYTAHNRANEERDREKLEIQRKRAEAYDFKARNPAWKMVPSKGGNVFFVSPDGTQKIDTGIPTGSMTDFDRINLMNDRRDAQIDVQQAGADRRNENTVQGAQDRSETSKWAPYQIDGKWYDYNSATGEKRPITGEGNTPVTKMEKVSTPSRGGSTSEYQIKQGRFNRANQYKQEHPEIADAIHIENGEVTIDPPNSGILGWGGNSMDAKKYAEAHDVIFGPELSVGQSTAPPLSPGGPRVQLPPPPQQRQVGMIWKFPNGSTGKWDGKGWVKQ